MKKLIIWDFDGVISDTEFVWVDVWRKHLKEKHNIDISLEEAFSKISGIGTEVKIKRIKDYYGIDIDEKEHQEILQKELVAVNGTIKLTEGIQNVFKLSESQCLGTGSTYINAVTKVKALDIDNFFNKNNTFTKDDVKLGKPHPDLFLFAAKQMSFKPQNCIVIEDALAGVEAAIRADMDVIGFVEHHHINKEIIINKMKELGAKKIAHNMKEVEEFIRKALI